jgi:hypothetical protein
MRRSRSTGLHRHEFGTPNPIMCAEEASMLADVQRAAWSVKNSQILGRNGEIPLLRFFTRYLPSALRVATGCFVTPGGRLSPQIDVLILDSRYPLLAENADGSVRAMLHAVVWALEVKTTLRTADCRRMWENAQDIMIAAGEIKGYGIDADPISVRTSAFAYRAAQGIDATRQSFTRTALCDNASLAISILRVLDKNKGPRGAELILEANVPRGENRRPQWHAVTRFSHSLLSDLYYDVVRWSYTILDERRWTFGDISDHMMEYMAWSTDGEPDHHL